MLRVLIYNHFVNILSINLASHGSTSLTTGQGHIAVCSESAVLAWSEADHRMADNEVVPLIEKTLKDAKLTYSDLTHIACVTGPGGFTSIRSGVTIANVMSHELKIPLAGIHLSDLCLAQATGSPTWWLHSTKKEQLFLKGGSIHEPTLMNLADALELFHVNESWIGELIESQEKAVTDRGLMPGTIILLQQVLPKFLATRTYSSNLLEPWYGRGW